MMFTMIARSLKTMFFLKDDCDIRDGPDDCNVRVVPKCLDAIMICDAHGDCGLYFSSCVRCMCIRECVCLLILTKGKAAFDKKGQKKAKLWLTTVPFLSVGYRIPPCPVPE
jgi:hypothetical protein